MIEMKIDCDIDSPHSVSLLSAENLNRSAPAKNLADCNQTADKGPVAAP
jgi:hypothetical protein